MLNLIFKFHVVLGSPDILKLIRAQTVPYRVSDQMLCVLQLSRNVTQCV